MEECFKCGISGEKSKLHDAISGKGLVKICSRCSIDGDIPVIKRKEASLENADKTASMGGLIKEREKAFEQMKSGRRSPVMSRQDFTLRDLVEKNYKENAGKEKKAWPGVIRNFNWIILRARRNKGFGQKQLAEMIAEPEIAVRMAEGGILPKEYVPFIRKIERFLEVDLMENNPFRLEEHKKMLDFKEAPSKEITIRDVRSMGRRKEIERIKSREILAREMAEKEAKEAQELLDEEFERESSKEETYEEKKSSGFFKNIFSRKNTVSDEKLEEDSLLNLEKKEDNQKEISSKPIQNKEVPKFLSSAPGRTKAVPKYRWQR